MLEIFKSKLYVKVSSDLHITLCFRDIFTDDVHSLLYPSVSISTPALT